MRKQVLTAGLACLLTGTLAASVVAAGASPFGQLGGYEKVELVVDHIPVQGKGLLIDGELYIPASALRQQNKLAYVSDDQAYRAYLFFGGAATGATSGNAAAGDQKTLPDKRAIELSFMAGIPYEADNYHAGMMRQDIINIATLAKALLRTSSDWEKAVYAKITYNRNPNMALLRQQLAYRTVPFTVLEDRMEALAEELGKQISRKYERRMQDVIDDLQDAVENKERALDALEDWLKSSDEDDLEDYRDYDEDANESIYDAIEKLTGENLKKPSDYNDNNIQAKVKEWSLKQQQRN